MLSIGSVQLHIPSCTLTCDLAFFREKRQRFQCSLIRFFSFDSYVWKTLDVGYVQGMCDLVAPLLVIFDSGKLFDSGICRLS